ncbi:MAG: hypothetical protein PHW91_05590 [Bacteroidales bacterium]|nr:hypothetical protein [Bacteroidales bacterium]
MTHSFSQLEAKWLNIICHFLRSVYKHTHLPSHDLSHHIRVWHNCKTLMVQPSVSPDINPAISAEHLLIASLFHDTGLTIDNSEEHGFVSVEICKEFFNQNPNLKTDNLDMVNFAIEHHDDKSLQLKDFKDLSPALQLTRLLSTSDDLDAFGIIGVYRYIEIYSLRGNVLEVIPQKVLTNMANRFDNFIKLVNDNSNFTQYHTKRYHDAVCFFKNLDCELKDKTIGLGNHVYFAESIIHNIIEKGYSTKQTIDNELNVLHEGQVLDWFNQLKNEIEHPHTALL